jgi:hypothetical protein
MNRSIAFLAIVAVLVVAAPPAADARKLHAGIMDSVVSACTDMAKCALKSALNSTIQSAASGETTRPGGTRAAIAGMAAEALGLNPSPVPAPKPAPAPAPAPAKAAAALASSAGGATAQLLVAAAAGAAVLLVV